MALIHIVLFWCPIIVGVYEDIKCGSTKTKVNACIRYYYYKVCMDLISCKVKKYELKERGGGMDLMRVFGFFGILEIFYLNKF